MVLITNWRSAWKMFSVQIPAVNVALLATWAALPEKFQNALPASWMLAVAAVLIVIGVIGRLIKQPEVSP